MPSYITYNTDKGVLEMADNNIVKLLNCNNTLQYSCRQSYHGYGLVKKCFAALRIIQPGKPISILNSPVS